MPTITSLKYGSVQTPRRPSANDVLVQPTDISTANILTGLSAFSTDATDMYPFISSLNNSASDPLSSYLNWTSTGLEALNDSWTNNSFSVNATEEDSEDFSHLLFMGVTSIFLGLMILMTVIGNVFVIAAILLERNLQSVANYLIVSLAVADLMVACLVMPLGAVYEISQGWILGPELCDMWTSSDVLCCTASILHLVAIAVDRYWAVTNVDYIHTRNSNRIGIMIVVVWTVALVVSLAPQFGWKDPDYLDRINVQQRCLVSQDVAYQIFATCSTFYVPLLVILVLYWKIFQTARKRIRRRQVQHTATVSKPSKMNNNTNTSKSARGFLSKRRFLKMKRTASSKQSSAAEALVASLVMVEGQSTTASTAVDGDVGTTIVEEMQPLEGNEAVTAFTISCQDETAPPVEQQVRSDQAVLEKVSNNVSPEKSSATTTNNGSASHQSHISDISRVEIISKEPQCPTTPVAVCDQSNLDRQHIPSRREKRETLEAKRERKAAKTLAIITGAFVVCWLPFFIMALWMPLCATCEINPYLASFFLWLGYFNSTLNPVIYTIFSPEFRQAFKRILCGAHRKGRSYRSAKIR